jgi:hypothetical protein
LKCRARRDYKSNTSLRTNECAKSNNKRLSQHTYGRRRQLKLEKPKNTSTQQTPGRRRRKNHSTLGTWTPGNEAVDEEEKTVIEDNLLPTEKYPPQGPNQLNKNGNFKNKKRIMATKWERNENRKKR